MKHTVEVMITEQEVSDRVKELGQQITEHYKGSEDLVMIGYYVAHLYSWQTLRVRLK